MGAWGTNVVSNDHVMDEVISWENKVSDDYWDKLESKAAKESLQSLEFFEINNEYDEDEETYDREIYVGMIYYLLSNHSSLIKKELNKSLILKAQKYCKELCKNHILQRWVNIGERISSLQECDEILEKAIKNYL